MLSTSTLHGASSEAKFVDQDVVHVISSPEDEHYLVEERLSRSQMDKSPSSKGGIYSRHHSNPLVDGLVDKRSDKAIRDVEKEVTPSGLDDPDLAARSTVLEDLTNDEDKAAKSTAAGMDTGQLDGTHVVENGLDPSLQNWHEPSEDLRRLIAEVQKRNTAIVIPGFLSVSSDLRNVSAILQVIENALTPAPDFNVAKVAVRSQSPVLYIVQNMTDCVRRHGSFAGLSNLKLWREHSSESELQNLSEDTIRDYQVFIVTGEALRVRLRKQDFSLLSFSLIVFDECEDVQSPDHCYAAIVRDYYRTLEDSRRPRILAIAASYVGSRRSHIQNNLNVKFLSQEPDTACKEFYCQAPLPSSASPGLEVRDVVIFNCSEAPVVSSLGYASPSNSKAIRSLKVEQEKARQMTDKEYLIAELGPLAVTLYQRSFKRRMMIRRWKKHPHLATAKSRFGQFCSEAVLTNEKMLLGLTKKALTLLSTVKTQMDSASSGAGLSIIIHAGRAVVAIAIGELMKFLRGFGHLRISVVLGNVKSARSFEDVGEEYSDISYHGDDTDDEAVDAFNSGLTDILVVASDQIEQIEKLGRNISPAALIIRFDGSASDPHIDGAGGLCRVLTFTHWKSVGLISPEKKVRPTSSYLSDSDNKETPRASDSNSKKRPRSSAKSNFESNTDEKEQPKKRHRKDGRRRDRTEDQKKKRASSKDKKAVQASRESDGLLRLRAMEGGGIYGCPIDILSTKQQTYEIKTVTSLRGPSPDRDSVVYLYLLAGPSHPSGSSGEASYATGLENFAVCLSERLPSAEEVVYAAQAVEEIPILRLLFMGSYTFTPEQVQLARDYHSLIFSVVMPGVHSDNFEWGPKDYAFRQYTVVAVRPKLSDVRRQFVTADESTESNSMKSVFKKYFGEKRVERQLLSKGDAAEYEIDWNTINKALDFQGERKRLFEPSPNWELIKQKKFEKISDYRTLEGRLVYTNHTKNIMMSGPIRPDQSPLLNFVTTVTFELDEKGYKKCITLPGNRKLPLPRRDRREMELVKLKAKLRENGINVGKHRNKDGRSLDKRLIRTLEQLDFDPERNRKKGRDIYYESREDTYENYFVMRRGAKVSEIGGPLIEATRVSCFDIPDLVKVANGRHIMYSVEAQIAKDTKSRDPMFLVPEHVAIFPVHQGAMFLPVALMHLERHAITCDLHKRLLKEIDIEIPVSELTKALTFASVDGGSTSDNYERLELLGDSVLKLASTIRLFSDHPHQPEGWMHVRRCRIVNNDTLMKLAKKMGLEHYLRAEKEVLGAWKPPGLDRVVKKQLISDKSMADVVESLCGVFFLHGALRDPAKFLESGYEFGMRLLEVAHVLLGKEPTREELLLSAIHSLHPKSSAPPRSASPSEWPDDVRVEKGASRISKLEKLIGYVFTHKQLLLCALTHPSYVEDRRATEHFQRLEFLGDAVLDLCVAKYLFERYPNLGPGELTDLKGVAVSNETFARISLKMGLHKFLYCRSEVLADNIASYRASVLEEERAADRMRAYWLQEHEAPKVLSDIFEAVAGAILIDSGMDVVWKIFSKLLKETLDVRANPLNFKLHPVKRLQDLVTRTEKLSIYSPQFIIKGKDRNNLIHSVVSVHSTIIGEGRGSTKRRAQCIAAEDALRNLMNSKNGKDGHTLWNTLQKKGWEEKRS